MAATARLNCVDQNAERNLFREWINKSIWAYSLRELLICMYFLFYLEILNTTVDFASHSNKLFFFHSIKYDEILEAHANQRLNTSMWFIVDVWLVISANATIQRHEWLRDEDDDDTMMPTLTNNNTKRVNILLDRLIFSFVD